MNPLVQSWRVLVVANETVASEILLEAIDLRGRGAEVLVVAPALNSRLAFLVLRRGSRTPPGRRAPLPVLGSARRGGS
jgi:hypothetical protein